MGRSGFSYVTGVVLALAVAGSSVAFGAAEVGEKAPPLKIRQWIKGKPITLAQGRGKNVFIVEFWATWCGPCKVTIPHLSHLQKRFADQGVVVVGISDEAPAAARPFVEKQEKMNYRVACDDGRKTIGAYLKRGSGIPQAFVVDKAGVVVWQGHPMGGLERVVEQVAAGTFDAKVQAKKERLREDALSALRRGDGTRRLEVSSEKFFGVPRAACPPVRSLG